MYLLMPIKRSVLLFLIFIEFQNQLFYTEKLVFFKKKKVLRKESSCFYIAKWLRWERVSDAMCHDVIPIVDLDVSMLHALRTFFMGCVFLWFFQAGKWF